MAVGRRPKPTALKLIQALGTEEHDNEWAKLLK
jgi:hypothetical protein